MLLFKQVPYGLYLSFWQITSILRRRSSPSLRLACTLEDEHEFQVLEISTWHVFML
jgi:hypothetical protein